jgi:hypothetical protein
VGAMRPQPLICVTDVEASSRWYQRLLSCRGGHGGRQYEQLVKDGSLILQLHGFAVEHHHGPIGNRADRPYGNGVLLSKVGHHRVSLESTKLCWAKPRTSMPTISRPVGESETRLTIPFLMSPRRLKRKRSSCSFCFVAVTLLQSLRNPKLFPLCYRIVQRKFCQGFHPLSVGCNRLLLELQMLG